MTHEIALESDLIDLDIASSILEKGEDLKILLPKGRDFAEKIIPELNALAKKLKINYSFRYNEGYQAKTLRKHAAIGALVGGLVGGALTSTEHVSPKALPLFVALGAGLGAATQLLNYEIQISERNSGITIIHFKSTSS